MSNCRCLPIVFFFSLAYRPSPLYWAPYTTGCVYYVIVRATRFCVAYYYYYWIIMIINNNDIIIIIYLFSSSPFFCCCCMLVVLLHAALPSSSLYYFLLVATTTYLLLLLIIIYSPHHHHHPPPPYLLLLLLFLLLLLLSCCSCHTYHLPVGNAAGQQAILHFCQERSFHSCWLNSNGKGAAKENAKEIQDSKRWKEKSHQKGEETQFWPEG